MNVLIMETDEFLVRLLAAGLRVAGFATLIACDFAQATELISRKKVDAVILGTAVLERSSPDAIRWLKLSKENYDLPILLVDNGTGFGVRTAVAIETAGFFPTPPNINAMAACLQRVSANCRPRQCDDLKLCPPLDLANDDLDPKNLAQQLHPQISETA